LERCILALFIFSELSNTEPSRNTGRFFVYIWAVNSKRMTGLNVENIDGKLILSIDKSNFSESVLLKVMEIARLEYLVNKGEFNEGVLEVDEEMKENWWKNNKDRLIGKQPQ
jgi:hypothetical protein